MIENIAKIERFNFWKSDLHTGFLRDQYLQRITKYDDTQLVRVLVGQRRVGKSYLLRQLIKNLIEKGVDRKATLYINMEYLEYDFIKTPNDLVTFVNAVFSDVDGSAGYHVFIDEVQNIEGWERAVNAMSQDFTRKISVYITGSNSKLLSGELATHLSGRYIQFLVLPYVFAEFCEIQNIPQSKESYIQFMSSGGMPELLNLPDEDSKRNYMQSLYDTIILRDIVARQNVRDVVLLKDIFIFLANNISNLVSVQSLVKYFKGQNRNTNYQTVSQYISYLEDAFVVHRCDRYNLAGKEVLSGTSKYYLNDLSFCNYLFGSMLTGYGYQLENLVYLELRHREFEISCGTLRNKEVDFVVTKGDQTEYYQVSFSLFDETTREREFASLLAIKDNYPKNIITLDDFVGREIKGIKVQTVYKLD
jgi:predicted AAA+ superfamily ATPase